jgi:predicted transcriptional regulator
MIISPEDSVLHELNATASFIWKQATGERTARAIAEMLASEYEVAPETALTDTEELIAHLMGKNLLLAEPPAVEARSDA